MSYKFVISKNAPSKYDGCFIVGFLSPDWLQLSPYEYILDLFLMLNY